MILTKNFTQKEIKEMQRCQNCYWSFVCKMQNPEKYEKHHEEDIVSCLNYCYS